jgi:hypothetical protein
MNPNNFVLSQCLVSLAILAIFVHLFGRLRRDEFRSHVRRLRDGLFDFMWKNGYDFDTPAYRQMRQLLNGIIRLSTVPMPLVFFLVTARVYRDKALVPAKQAEADNSPLAEELRRVRREVTWAITWFLMFRGPLGVAVLAAAVVLSAGQLLAKIPKFLETVAWWAYRLGSPDLSEREYSRMVGGPECRAGA